MAKQNEKTIQFWDDFYTSEPTHHKEWILHPSVLIFQHLWERLPSDVPVVRILEIGCGTSSLSRDFYQFCQDRDNYNNTTATTSKRRKIISICATDVSDVCIQQCQERDRDLLLSPASNGEEFKGSLEYRVLNIAEALDMSDLEPNSFDMVLDKGCLDTFLFRSRQRGSQKDALPQRVLDNIHMLLKKEFGIYAIMTPRSKFHVVQHYPGFSKVDRMPLDIQNLQVAKAELVEHQGPKIKQNGKVKEEKLYLYTCYKGEKKDEPREETLDIPDDKSKCPKCSMTFLDYRKGEDIMNGRGAKFWVREWKGHIKHCKGNAETTV